MSTAITEELALRRARRRRALRRAEWLEAFVAQFPADPVCDGEVYESNQRILAEAKALREKARREL